MALIKDPVAHDEKIGELNLIALRKYACAKINSQKDWYLKCVECRGLDGCSAGKRAIELIEEETKPRKSQTEKFNERMKKTVIAQHKTQQADKYIEAMKTDDPAGYLVEKGYFDVRWRATDALKQWRKRYDIEEEKNVDIEILSKSKEKKKEKLSREGKVELRAKKLFEGCTCIMELFQKFVEETPDIKATAVATRLYDWMKKYPWINKEYPYARDLARMMTNSKTQYDASISARDFYEIVYGKKIRIAEKTEETASASDEDEVSVDDFLKEQEMAFEADIPETASAAQEITKPTKVLWGTEEDAKTDIPGKTESVWRTEPIRIKTSDAMDILRKKQITEEDAAISMAIDKLNRRNSVVVGNIHGKSSFRGEFMQKYQKLYQDLYDVEQEITQLQLRRTELRGKIQTLYDAMVIFGIEENEEEPFNE